MPKGYVYILECSDGSFYTGSAINLEVRIQQHQNGEGANHTKKRLPVKLVYAEEFQRIDDAFYREKQIQGWSRNKKNALIEKNYINLPKFSKCKNDSHYKNVVSTPLNHQKLTPLINEVVAKRSRSYSNGKLLLTGEYLVLDGALALAIPTKFGQSLSVKSVNKSKLHWQSIDNNEQVWFENSFDLKNGEMLKQVQHDDISKRLAQILKAAKQLNPSFLKSERGFDVEAKLGFPRNWGLGSSSTLINNIANWANVDAYKLLELTFGGSGYDIACAQHDSAITYKLDEDKRIINQVNFNPSFKEQLYFVYLNKKQDSREGIAKYKANRNNLSSQINEISDITAQMISSESLSNFSILINTHESIIASIIKQIPVKQLLFNDFYGSIKSLGAWGGDFVLVTSESNPTNYFKNKGFETIIPFNDMAL